VQRVKRVNQTTERRDRRKKRWRLRVVAIDPAKYPAFMNDPDHPFSGMDPERRIEELVTFCGALWARACEEAAQKAAENIRPSEAA